MKRVNIYTDKSSDSDAKAKLLARGIQRCGTALEVEIMDVAKTPKDAGLSDFTSQTSEVDNEPLLNADALLFPTTGTLSVFEKHFLNNWDEGPLRGKKYGVLMANKTTFDGPSATEGHTLDNKLIERLAQQGLSHFPVVVERTEDDQEIETAGERFIKSVFP
ncbi:hypothetical protein BDB00DRAFT_799625 [Zychaea mexicana]|uniref:uncharacterized protein n=1 Tax=Zychaea mexicana TaxID=64656 RepID=UPI0022FDF7EC|nr:uncharacterized protein BDB00DRAFT_799625 [Zychaea mexicana]KAI9498816.1 hypothetical protein BDB00DRAFT_799625 [Zychaea mexicana]